MMKVDKSLEEVWQWKEQIYKETKGMTMHDRCEYIRKGAEDACKKYNLHLKKAPTKARF